MQARNRPGTLRSPLRSEKTIMSAPETNLLLDALSPESRERILRACRYVPLPSKTVLFEAGTPLDYAYFLTSGVASIVIELADGGSAEVALIGYEGLVGGLQLLGPAMAPSRCFLQVAGGGYRIPFSELKKIFRESEEIRNLILQGVQQQSLTMSQLAACNKLHEAEPRLARWLLMVQDRVQESTLTLTQEFLAQMLGTQRTTVVMVAGAFQRSGLISYSRGKVSIHSREDLESAACDCYKVVRELYDNLYENKQRIPKKL